MNRHQSTHQVSKVRFTLVVLVLACAVGQQASAQNLTLALFERYLNSLREQAAIPGLSAAIVQNGALVWSRASGKQDLEANIFARTDTPYEIGGLAQALASTLLLENCVERRTLDLSDTVARWLPAFPDPQATIANLLTHTTALGGYHQDLGRFA